MCELKDHVKQQVLDRLKIQTLTKGCIILSTCYYYMMLMKGFMNLRDPLVPKKMELNIVLDKVLLNLLPSTKVKHISFFVHDTMYLTGYHVSLYAFTYINVILFTRMMYK